MSPRHYLLVDDNRAFGENVAEILRDEGNEVTLSTDAAQAVKLVRDRRYDALVTDMRMPGMGGAQLVHEARRADPGLPAVVVSAYTAEHDLDDARRAGLLAVLSKPVPIPRLTALLAKARRNAVVALVEDDEAFADNLCELLTNEGFAVLAARSLEEAEALFGARPMVAVVDLRLPGSLDGAAAKRLAERFPAVPLVVITGFPTQATALPPHTLFVKPFETQRLLAHLNALHAEAVKPR
ncbi:MAG: response regulator [Myxococcaceae bacterium]